MQVDESKGSRRLLDVMDRLRDCPNARERGRWAYRDLDRRVGRQLEMCGSSEVFSHFGSFDREHGLDGAASLRQGRCKRASRWHL